MNGYCTYTVEVLDDEGYTRDIPCGKSRVGEVTGAVSVVLCHRHFDAVSRAMARLGPKGMRLLLDEVTPTASGTPPQA